MRLAATEENMFFIDEALDSSAEILVSAMPLVNES